MGHPQKIVVVDAQDRVGTVLKILMENELMAVPVREGSSGPFLGLVDVTDLTSWVVRVVEETQAMPLDYRSFLEREELFVQQNTLVVADSSHRDPWHTVTIEDPLIHALHTMKNKCLHRVAVVGEEGSVWGLLTSSDVLQYVHKIEETGPRTHGGIAALRTLWGQSVSSTGAGTSPVLTVHYEAPTTEAFKLMAQSRVSAVAVVNDTGMLVGNVSAHDVETLHHDFSRLYLSVAQFVSKTRREREHVPDEVVSTCRPHSTVREVVETMLRTGVHRVYMTDEQAQPLCVISVSDILGLLTA
eukprot:TRINITY_DN1231_c0_g3_i1.p1 TRINITY_DN1231_c0_g3~~TRINITY_DN1231_c0_g3_i1.p1  ORF type:complete len:322 (-),score=59.93 TRINITY_DN1231_c0_g3_i1:516-1415(-)